MEIYLDYSKDRVSVLCEQEDWSSNSPDLNPMDYGVWEDLEASIYRHPIHTMEELKARIVQFWEDLKISHKQSTTRTLFDSVHVCAHVLKLLVSILST